MSYPSTYVAFRFVGADPGAVQSRKSRAAKRVGKVRVRVRTGQKTSKDPKSVGEAAQSISNNITMKLRTRLAGCGSDLRTFAFVDAIIVALHFKFIFGEWIKSLFRVIQRHVLQYRAAGTESGVRNVVYCKVEVTQFATARAEVFRAECVHQILGNHMDLHCINKKKQRKGKYERGGDFALPWKTKEKKKQKFLRLERGPLPLLSTESTMLNLVSACI